MPQVISQKSLTLIFHVIRSAISKFVGNKPTIHYSLMLERPQLRTLVSHELEKLVETRPQSTRA